MVLLVILTDLSPDRRFHFTSVFILMKICCFARVFKGTNGIRSMLDVAIVPGITGKEIPVC
jgi:hypothetical protein